ncbi:MAG TPA: tetrahydromethanopterin S-methyltransferase subunit A [Candidatus Nitrosotenuis sp.]|nr:tetrahydromethanopterin S-methyltransferase subunit A [Candidatus Nitrosotenuis sp.]
MRLVDVAGEICRILLPIREEVFYGNPASHVAVCTLASMDLLKEISGSGLLGKIRIAGRLLSENKGIDALLSFVSKNPTLKTLIVCGREVPGHLAGHSLVSLYKYGTDRHNRIINSISPEPVLTSTRSQIEQFRRQIVLVDKIGETDMEKLRKLIDSI